MNWFRSSQSLPQTTGQNANPPTPTKDAKPTSPTKSESGSNTQRSRPNSNTIGSSGGAKDSGREVVSMELIQARFALAEWERKNHVLSESLSEKAEENISLQEENRTLQDKVKILETQVARLEELSVNKEQETNAKAETNKELLRRLETMSESLSAMADENLRLKSQRSDVKGSSAANIKGSALESALNARAQVGSAKLSAAEEAIVVLKAQLHRANQKDLSYQEATKDYEQRIKEMSSKMRAHQKKEAARRKQAEHEVQRLKQKVEELEFLLEEKGASGESWSESKSSSDEKDNK